MKSPIRIVLGIAWIASLALAYQFGLTKQPAVSEHAMAIGSNPSSPSSPVKPPDKPIENLKPPAQATAATEETAPSKLERFVRERKSDAADDWPDRSAKQRLPDAITEALANSDPIERMSTFTEALRRLDPSNVQEVLTAFEEMPGDHADDQEFSMFLFAWARIDGASAMSYIDEEMDGWRAHRTAYSAMSGWANTDPDGAVAWAKEKHEGPDNPYLIGVVNGVAKTDLAKATEITQSLPYGRIRAKAVDVLIDGYLKEGVDTTMGWAGELESGVLKNGIVERVAGRVARDDPYAAAQWANGLESGEERSRAVASVAETWSRSQPLEAANYSMTIEDSELRNKALGEVVERWARADQDAAGEWLTEHKEAPGMDGALYQYAERIRFKDPVGAMTWAASIQDEPTRHKLMEQVAEEWMERDPDAAKAFLAK